MVTILEIGRLCNQIIRNLAASLLVAKNDFAINYCNHDAMCRLGIPLHYGTTTFHTTIQADEGNYIALLDTSPHYNNIDVGSNFYQTYAISTYLYNYLRSDKIRNQIIEKNPYRTRYQNNDDIFIHVRLEDVLQMNKHLPYSYYKIVLDSIDDAHSKHIYISTSHDALSVNSGIIQQLLKEYPNSELFLQDEINTIQFASTCKYVILSHGSFSAVIGWLSFYSTVYWAELDKSNLWCGEMFRENDNNWIKIALNKYLE